MRIFDIKINLAKIVIVMFTVKILLSYQNILEISPMVDECCVAFAVAVFVLKLLRNPFTVKKFCWFALIGALVLFTCYEIKQYDVLISFITIFLIKDENFEECIRLMLITEIVVMIFICLMGGVAVLQGREKIFFSIKGDRVRFKGAMIHANVFSGCIFSCLLMTMWLCYEKISKKHYMIWGFVAAVAFVLTDTRTTLLLTVFSMSFLVLRNNRYVQKWCEKYLIFLFPVLVGVIYYWITHFVEGSTVAMYADNLLTGRIELGAYAYERSGITFLPRFLDYAEEGKISWEQAWGLNKFTFDNLYSFLWVQFGFVWIMVITILIGLLVSKTEHKCRFFILIWILYGFTEVHGLNCYKFFPILLASRLFYSKVKNDDTAVNQHNYSRLQR